MSFIRLILPAAALLLSAGASASSVLGDAATEVSARSSYLLQMGVWQSPIAPNEELYSFIERLGHQRPPQDIMPRGSDGTVDCRPVRGFRSTQLCVFNYAIIMNAVLGRASAFAEQGQTILSHLDHLSAVRNRNAEGHNLGAATLSNFWNGFSRLSLGFTRPTDDFDREYLQVEAEFWNTILLPWLRVKNDVYLAAVAFDANYRVAVPHELLHALYFENSDMRRIVSAYWSNSLTDAERSEVRKILSDDYDPQDEALMINEFQAYVLTPPANRNPLATVAAKHRAALTKLLLRSGIDPSLSDIANDRCPANGR